MFICVCSSVPLPKRTMEWKRNTKLEGCASMGVLSTLMRGLVRGADRMSEFTSKRGSRTHNKGRGARPAGRNLPSSKFLAIRSMIPEFVVPPLEGFKLRPYVSYRAPKGTEPPLTVQSLFDEVVAPQIKQDFEAGIFSKDQLEKYGFEPTQEGKLFKLYPKNYVR
uniref:Mitochondrial ribosomal protein L41 n=2 Tax=Oreochromis niloticus TaxID=8128 RepID=I3KZQ0_ORENI